MEENLKVDKKFKRAFNLGYELAKELDLKAPMFADEGSDITSKSPMQAGIFQYVVDAQTTINKRIVKSKKTSETSTIKKTFGKNRNKDKGLTL